MLLHVQVRRLFQTLAAISVHDFHGIATSCSLLGRGIDRGKGAPAKAQKYTGLSQKSQEFSHVLEEACLTNHWILGVPYFPTNPHIQKALELVGCHKQDQP